MSNQVGPQRSGSGERLALVAMLLAVSLVLSVLGILAVSKGHSIEEPPYGKSSAETVELRREREHTRIVERPIYPENSEPRRLKLEGLVPPE